MLPDLNQQAITWLFKLRAEDISPEEMHDFAEWLSQDAAHATAFGQAEDMFDDMIAAGKSLRQKLCKSMDDTSHKTAPATTPVIDFNPTKTQKPPGRLKHWLAVPIALAAAWLFAVVSVMPRQAHLFDAYFSDYHTGTGELRDIVLTDGSHLLLNTNSAVSVDYQNNLRVIALHHGQVSFTVAKDNLRPFDVQSGGLTVRALGTVFEVYNPENGDISVAVQEHAVSATLSASKSLAQAQTVTIMEGQQLQYLGGKRLPAPVATDLSRLTAWQQRKLFINDQPVSEVVAELNRYRNDQIYLQDAELNNQHIMGVFSLADTDEALHTLSNALALKETRIGRWWVVLHR